MQFPLKFDCCPCPPYARKFVRDKILSEVTQAARLFHEGTQFKDIKETSGRCFEISGMN